MVKFLVPVLNFTSLRDIGSSLLAFTGRNQRPSREAYAERCGNWRDSNLGPRRNPDGSSCDLTVLPIRIKWLNRRLHIQSNSRGSRTILLRFENHFVTIREPVCNDSRTSLPRFESP